MKRRSFLKWLSASPLVGILPLSGQEPVNMGLRGRFIRNEVATISGNTILRPQQIAQEAYNIWRTAQAERIALQPRGVGRKQ